jgi:hypothetical protein
MMLPKGLELPLNVSCTEEEEEGGLKNPKWRPGPRVIAVRAPNQTTCS